MGFGTYFSDIGRGFQENPLGSLASGWMLGGAKIGRDARKEDQAQEAQQSELQGLLQQGMGAGKKEGAEIYGRDEAALGDDVSEIRERRRALMEGPSRAASEVRAGGQQKLRQAKAAGMSEAGQRQVSMDTNRTAGAQEEASYLNNLSNFQSAIGNEASTRLALNPLMASLYMQSQYTAPPSTAGKGLLAGLGL